MRYLIDGYNFLFRLLHSGEDVRKIRDQFISELIRKVNAAEMEACLVFDSKYQAGELTVKKEGFLDILYTNEGESADEWLLKELKQVGNPRLVTVVTSDRRLAMHCRMRGSFTIEVDAFKSLLTKRVKKKVKKNLEPLNPLPPSPKKKLKVVRTLDDFYLEAFQKNVPPEPEVKMKPPKEKQIPKTKREKRTSESEMDRWMRLFQEGNGA